MWLSEMMSKKGVQAEEQPEVAVSRVAGSVLGEGILMADILRREAALCAPCGYYWRPPAGSQVLVLKSNEDKKSYAVGGVFPVPSGLEEGEVLISSQGGASIYLKNDGTVALFGDVYINGVALADMLE